MTTPPPEPAGYQKLISEATGLTDPAALACVEAMALIAAPALPGLPPGEFRDLARAAMARAAMGHVRDMSARGELRRFCEARGLRIPHPTALGIK